MNVVVLFSGGIDSTTLLYKLVTEGHYCRTLSVDYGQSHKREIRAAAELAEEIGVPHQVTFLDPDLFKGSDLTGGHGGVVVPNRNMVLISLAGAVADCHGYDYVAVACHAGDHELFPDCRTMFLEETFKALRRATEHRVGLLYPFARMSKLDVVRLGRDLKVPFDRTWSCYVGGEEPCGTCLACIERREALFLAGTMA